MKNLATLLLAATVLAGGIAATAPASAAASNGSSGIMRCDTGNAQDLINQSKHELAQQLQLRTKSAPTIDEWNGCLKVQYTDDSGHNVVALYDPDSLSLVNKLS
jgi:hypothetical protein